MPPCLPAWQAYEPVTEGSYIKLVNMVSGHSGQMQVGRSGAAARGTQASPQYGSAVAGETAENDFNVLC